MHFPVLQERDDLPSFLLSGVIGLLPGPWRGCTRRRAQALADPPGQGPVVARVYGINSVLPGYRFFHRDRDREGLDRGDLTGVQRPIDFLLVPGDVSWQLVPEDLVRADDFLRSPGYHPDLGIGTEADDPISGLFLGDTRGQKERARGQIVRDPG